MYSELMMDAIYAIGILLFSLLILLLPLRFLAAVTTPFSFRTFGIRRIKRWHSHTDTLANLMLWISVLFCLGYAWIPYAAVIYAVWLTFTWLCTLARAVRMSEVRERWKKMTVIFFINMIYGFGLLCGLGVFSYYSLPIRTFLFANEIMTGQGLNYMYYLTSPQPAAWLLQTLLMLIVLCTLWGQFKYMRLENTFKGRNLFTYVFKCLIVLVIVLGIGMFGQRGIEKVYQVPGEERISSSNRLFPIQRSDVETPEGSVIPSFGTQPADPDQPADPSAPAQTPEQTPDGGQQPEANPSQTPEQPAGLQNPAEQTPGEETPPVTA